MPKFGSKVPHLRCNSHVYQFQGQTVKGQGQRRAGYTESAEPSGHTACLTFFNLPRPAATATAATATAATAATATA